MKRLNKIDFLNKIKDAEVPQTQDSVSDFLEGVLIIEELLGDGFNMTDLFGLMQLEPKVRELVNDAPLFLQEIKKEQPMMIIYAIDTARNDLENKYKFGTVANAIFYSLRGLAMSYNLADTAYKMGLEVKVNFEKGFAKNG